MTVSVKHGESCRRLGPMASVRMNHLEFLRVLNFFQDLLRDIRFEGKARRGENLKKMRLFTAFFKKDVRRHFMLEENVLFPFLKKHIPKLESAASLLENEHEDFGRQVKLLERLIGKLAKENVKSAGQSDKTAREIYETGTYMIYLLRNHIRAENSLVYKTAGICLKPYEKNLLKKKTIGA